MAAIQINDLTDGKGDTTMSGRKVKPAKKFSPEKSEAKVEAPQPEVSKEHMSNFIQVLAWRDKQGDI